MNRSLCFLALLLGATNVGADAPCGHAASKQAVTGRSACSCGYQAEVEVSLGGVTRHGRVIVARDGRVHVEHLDERAAGWVRQVIREKPATSAGWEDRPLRAGPVPRVRVRRGADGVPAQIHTPEGSLEVSRYKPLPAR